MARETAVIILNYFGCEDCRACVASVKRHIEHAAVYIIDNSADTDEKNRLQALFSSEPHVHLIFSEKNLGFAAGVNLGLKQALAAGLSRFLVLNNDAVVLENCGSILDAAYGEHGGSLIAPSINWGGSICGGNYYHRYGGLIIRKKPKISAGWLFYLTGCALAFDRLFLDRAGFFSESFFMYGEDVELSVRACARGIPLVCLPQILINHEGSKSARMASLFYEYHIARAHYLLTFCTLQKKGHQLVSLGGKLLFLLLRACVRCLRFKTLAPLAALCLAPLKLNIRPS